LLWPHTVPLGLLKLKLSYQLIDIWNLNIRWGLSNGTHVMLTGIRQEVLQVGLPDGQYEMILQIHFTVIEGGMPWVLYRCQFPVILAFAMTINKA
jgi:hypothetical protein